MPSLVGSEMCIRDRLFPPRGKQKTCEVPNKCCSVPCAAFLCPSAPLGSPWAAGCGPGVRGVPGRTSSPSLHHIVIHYPYLGSPWEGLNVTPKSSTNPPTICAHRGHKIPVMLDTTSLFYFAPPHARHVPLGQIGLLGQIVTLLNPFILSRRREVLIHQHTYLSLIHI